MSPTIVSPATAAAIAAEPKTVPCGKCGGSGKYRNLGVCYQCSGRGREVVGAPGAVSADLEKHLGCLRKIYEASARPSLESIDWDFNDPAGGISVYGFATEAMIGVLAAGDVETARKVCAAFAKLRGGAHFVWYITSGACDLRTWARLSGAAQRAALELAGREAPTTTDRKGAIVAAKTFGFND